MPSNSFFIQRQYKVLSSFLINGEGDNSFYGQCTYFAVGKKISVVTDGLKNLQITYNILNLPQSVTQSGTTKATYGCTALPLINDCCYDCYKYKKDTQIEYTYSIIDIKYVLQRSSFA